MEQGHPGHHVSTTEEASVVGEAALRRALELARKGEDMAELHMEVVLLL